MSFKTIEKMRLEQKFQNARITGSSTRALRNGYFFIVSVDYIDFKDNLGVPIATVLWKERAEEAFVKDVPFTVLLNPLSIDHPLDNVTLVNKTIFVYDVEIVEANESSAKPRVACKYEIISDKPIFTSLQALVIIAFGGESETVNDAYNTFEANLGIDLSSAIDAEPADDEVYDNLEDDEVYDNPEDDEVYDNLEDDEVYNGPEDDK